jgi:hypothetical protein
MVAVRIHFGFSDARRCACFPNYGPPDIKYTANFSRRIINGYSRVTARRTSLLRKNERFEWSSYAQEAF